MKKHKKKPPCDPTESHNHPADCADSKPKTSTVWRTFLKIDSPLLQDKAPVADALWLAQQGMNESSPIVVGLLRRHVVMLQKILGPRLKWMWFFVHNRESGVPTTEDDKAAYLDITLVFDYPTTFSLLRPYVMTRPDELSNACAGWDLTKLRSGTKDVHGLHNMQAQMVLQFLKCFHSDVDTMTILKHMRQYLHYLANVTQMRIA